MMWALHVGRFERGPQMIERKCHQREMKGQRKDEGGGTDEREVGTFMVFRSNDLTRKSKHAEININCTVGPVDAKLKTRSDVT